MPKKATESRPAEPSPMPREDPRLTEALAELRNLKETLLAQIAGQVEGSRRQAAHFAVTRALAESSRVEEAVTEVLRIACESLRWDLGELWLLDPRDCRLRWESFWHVPQLDARAFEKASWPLALARGEDLPGRVLEAGRGEWAADLSKEDSFLRGTAADRVGLRRACAVPVRGSQADIGVLAFFSCEPLPADPEVLDSLGDMARQLGLALERRQGAQARDRFFALSSEMLCVAGFDGYLRHVNPVWCRVTGHPADVLLNRALLSFIHPEDRETASLSLRRLMDEETEASFENRFLRQDGAYVRLRWKASASLADKLIFAAASPV